VCARCTRILCGAAERHDAAQDVAGLDGLDELRIHALLRDGLAGPYGVLAEQRYPSDRARPNRTEGERCDIVLTREPDPDRNHLIDPLDAGTLFEGRGVRAEDACWLEVKVAWRHLIIDGVGAANPRYGATLRREAPRDLRKLAKDDAIRSAGLILVMFTPDECDWRGDAERWRGLGSIEGWLTGRVWLDGFAITDRIGNGWCGVVVAEAD